MKKNKTNRYIIIASYVLLLIAIIAFRMPLYAGFLSLILLTGVIVFIYRADFYAFVAVIDHGKGKAEDSKMLFEKSIRISKKNVKTLTNYSVLLLREGEGEKAKELLDIAGKLPKDVMEDKNYTFTLGSCYWIQGDLDMALETLEGMRTKYDYVNSDVLSSLGYIYFLKNDLDKAMELSDMAIADKESNAIAYDNKGQIYFARGDMQSAKDNFELALKYKETLVDSLYYLGIIYEKEGNREKCKELFDRAQNAKISSLNSVTEEEVEKKYLEYTNL